MTMIGITGRVLSAACDNSLLVAYFLCQNVDSQLNTVAAILKGLIVRLSSQYGDLRLLLQSQWDSKTEQFTEDVFLKMLDRCTPRKAYVVIDALEECKEKEDMKDLLSHVVRRGLQSTLGHITMIRPHSV
jgi:hypothetical protein